MQVLEFLKVLKASPASRSASSRAAEIIVGQFKHDLLELHVVTRMLDFDGARQDGFVHDASTAEDYVKPVFVADNIPGSMSVTNLSSYVSRTGTATSAERDSKRAAELDEDGTTSYNPW